MGVDSGLPDFRGNEGFWKAYPPIAKLGLSFSQMANPSWFAKDPALAWGFYGHRFNLYRSTVPHAGFAILKRIAESKRDGYFAFTSNVDGAFQKAGFDHERIVECHGSISFWQCTRGCGQPIFDARDAEVQVDDALLRAADPLPACAKCGALARPNVLMFGDYQWDADRTQRQELRFDAYMRDLTKRRASVVVVECGAGTAIPTVRNVGDRMVGLGAKLVRINVREPDVPHGQIGIAQGALAALTAIDGSA